MTLDDKEIERLTKAAQIAFNGGPLSLYVSMGLAVRAILSELPDAPAWATPEAKAVLNYCTSHYLRGICVGRELRDRVSVYIASLKPKTVTLPERWLYEGGDHRGIVFYSAEAAEDFKSRCPGHITFIPAQTVTVGEK